MSKDEVNNIMLLLIGVLLTIVVWVVVVHPEWIRDILMGQGGNMGALLDKIPAPIAVICCMPVVFGLLAWFVALVAFFGPKED